MWEVAAAAQQAALAAGGPPPGGVVAFLERLQLEAQHAHKHLERDHHLQQVHEVGGLGGGGVQVSVLMGKSISV